MTDLVDQKAEEEMNANVVLQGDAKIDPVVNRNDGMNESEAPLKGAKKDHPPGIVIHVWSSFNLQKGDF